MASSITGTRGAAYGELFLLRYGAAQPDISIVNIYIYIIYQAEPYHLATRIDSH